MRILQVVAYYPPAWGYGGPPRVMFTLARGLVARGHQVTVFTTDAWDEHRRVSGRRADLDGVQVYYFRNLSNRLAWRHKKFLPLGLARWARANVQDFDVVHFSAVRSALHVITLPAVWHAAIPYVIDAHGSLPTPVGWKKPLGWLYDRWYLTPFLQRAAACLAQTDHEADLYRSFAPRARVKHLALPVSLEDIGKLPERGALRQRLGIPEHAFVAVFLGRIDRTKGVDFLVECFAQFRAASRRDAYLIIVGRDSGALETVLKRIRQLNLDSAVRFIGPLFGVDRFQAYTDADVFVSTPPYWEETSMAALEALACGTPAIITEQAAIPGLDQSGAGVTVRYGDGASVVRALAAYSMDSARRADASSRARRFVEERHDTARVCESLEDILREAVLREETRS